jgi:dinuclear metal center YbgI/SA1388 family protein
VYGIKAGRTHWESHVQLSEIITFFDQFAPRELSEDWDNVGLLLGDRFGGVQKVLTCLTLTPDVAAEAIENGIDLIVSHHPILFRAVKRITTDTTDGRMILNLAAANISVFSPHTRYDSADGGINQQLAELLDLTDIQVIRPVDPAIPEINGAGRYGALPQPMSLGEFVVLVRDRLQLAHVQFSGDADQTLRTVGVACGAAAEFMSDAQELGCDALLTGEARFHACLEARSRRMGLVQAGHYGTERPAMENLVAILRDEFPQLEVTASAVECDPVQWM